MIHPIASHEAASILREVLSDLDAAFPSNASPHRLLRLPEGRPILFVGDIHGDRDAVRLVLSGFPAPK
jgi:hypothetical protein